MTVLLILFLILLLLFSAFLSASETSLFSLSSHTLGSYKESLVPKEALVFHLMQKPRDVLVTILILNIFANLLVQNTVSGLFGAFSSWGFKVGVPLALTLIFGEVLPKSMALPNNKGWAKWVAPWISKVLRWVSPIQRPLVEATNRLSRILFFFLPEEEEISQEELRHLVKTSKASHVLLPEESVLVEGALDLESSRVLEKMRPREEILFYDIQDPLEKLISLFFDQEITRVPIADGNFDNLLGILSVRFYFFHREKIEKPSDLIPLLRKPYFVPEAIRASTLLSDMRQMGESLAIAVDEYGSISGLITQEDLIETVIGKVSDRRDEKNLYTKASEDVIIASGKLELVDFEKIFHTRMESKENVKTLGGWLTQEMGDIPIAGTKYATDQFLFYILAAEPNRIRRVYVRKISERPR